jgi:hypothetical protein
MTDENTVFDAAFEYQMNGMSEENARVAASEDKTKDARIAVLEAVVKHYLGAITDAAGGAPNMQRPAQIALLKLQAVIDWPTKGNGDAIRAALKAKP